MPYHEAFLFQSAADADGCRKLLTEASVVRAAYTAQRRLVNIELEGMRKEAFVANPKCRKCRPTMGIVGRGGLVEPYLH
jgi:hypothetical protein